ncbi:hypothetical protein [Metabacillus sp. RGM 3146]|uniref:hypothetical protein n=1 Tax=Metabacillus sp. RGM 3146 TaxID=3401092 RepID=UPI003B9DACF4
MIFKKKNKNKSETKKLEEHISNLEKTVQSLEKQLTLFIKHQETAKQKQLPPPIQKEVHNILHKETKHETLPMLYVEKIHIETLHMKEVDLSNNLGQLGVKELTGQLFIGTTYGKEADVKDKNVSGEKEEEPEGPKINLKSKTEKGRDSNET